MLDEDQLLLLKLGDCTAENFSGTAPRTLRPTLRPNSGSTSLGQTSRSESLLCPEKGYEEDSLPSVLSLAF